MFDIKNYESMAKFCLQESERAFLSDCANILIKSFDEMEEIDTDNIEPLITVLNIKNVLREDISAKYMSREELLSNAPEQYDGYFQVPKTLD